jgi:hypothetical protein
MENLRPSLRPASHCGTTIRNPRYNRSEKVVERGESVNEPKNIGRIRDMEPMGRARENYVSPYLFFTGRLTNLLSFNVNRHGKCAERVIPMRSSATTRTFSERGRKQRRASEHKSISW